MGNLEGEQMTTKELNAAIEKSHRAQLNGTDYQQAAFDAIPLGIMATDDELAEIESEPNPDCKCAACRKTQFE